jgi:membrane protease YdiL (CAAX protease family)
MSTSALLKLAIPAAAAAFFFFKFRRREFFADGLRYPTAQGALVWITIYLAWMLGSDLLIGWRGAWDFTPWQQAPLTSSILRVLAVCFAGPLLEEIVFRGILFGLVLRSRLGVFGAVLVTSLVWAPLHWDYSLEVISVIFVQGIVLGLARWRTGSLYVPVGCHVLWNLYAIW